MPYRRLPKTDSARLKALKVVLDNNDVYTAGNRIIEWKTLNKAQPAYDKLFDACQQYNISMKNQIKKSTKNTQLQRNAELYLSHFVQVLYMAKILIWNYMDLRQEFIYYQTSKLVKG